MRFASPLALLLLLVIPLILYIQLARKKRPAVRFSSIRHSIAAGPSIKQHFIRFPLFLRIVVLILLTMALARPQEGLEKVYDVSKGIAIEMVVDRSSSMGAEMEIDGKRFNRLEVVKRVFGEFVQGNQKGLAGRQNDLIGMVTFARYADTVCPLTLGHGALTGFLDNVKLVEQKSEDGTAIGDGLMLAAARLKKAEETLARQTKNKDTTYEIKSKIIILLTDGQNNAGEYPPAEAAAMAKEWGIKIYTIGVGEEERFSVSGLLGLRMRTGQGVDKKLLTSLAENTGGLFKMATSGKALREIYQEIDKLEKSEVESIRFVDYREYFNRFALLAFALLLLEIVLRNTLFRKVP